MPYKRLDNPKLAKIVVETEPRMVLRIEHPESKRGPFTHDAGRGRFASDAMVWLHEPQDFHKSLGSSTGYHWAFRDSEVLLGAVARMVLLREYGFHIQVYESVEHVVLPDGQVAFRKEKARLVRADAPQDFPFEDYFEEELA
ncbi:MAG: hypothetical protein ACN6OP_19590 [Pseudomonadales bacterium]